MRNSTFMTRSFLVAILILLTGPAALAGGPLARNPNDPDGVERWPGGGAGIPFNPDLGGLGTLNNAGAVQMVLDALQVWTDVPTATNTYSNNGPLGFDVTIANFGPFVLNLLTGTNTSDGLSPVVFDENGTIFSALFGAGSGVLGFASPDTFLPDGTPIEAVAFLNGGAILGGFPVPDFFALTVHEFGHYSGLGHSVVNGQNIVVGDSSGPTPFNTFGNSPLGDLETMYPFAIIGSGQESLHADEVRMLSFLYPVAGYLAATGSISGMILAPNGISPLNGINVIARNLADPFSDAVSAISGDRGIPGTYTLNGLTPGAPYAVFVDRILFGGFSTPPMPIPGPEEFYDFAESNNLDSLDDPSLFDPIVVSAGVPSLGIDIIINAPAPGDPLPLGDDGFSLIPLPFEHEFCGQSYSSVFVNANGNLTFDGNSPDFSESAAEMLAGQPRIAGLWDDLNPAAGGVVYYTLGGKKSITFHWEEVPEFMNSGANTFSITLEKRRIHIEYGDLSVADGLAGVSCGGLYTSGYEPEIDLTSFGKKKISLKNEAAAYERFTDLDNDLAWTRQEYDSDKGFKDRFEPNDSFARAAKVDLPFNTIDNRKSYSEILPLGEDVDYFKFEKLKAGQTLVAEVTGGQIDTVIQLLRIQGKGKHALAIPVATDDDSGVGPLSRIITMLPEDGDYVLAVSTFPDFDFNGDGSAAGRYVLNVFTFDGFTLTLGDDSTEEVPLGFAFPFQGNLYNSVFVNSNGNLTFGSGSIDFSETELEFLNDQPRIAALWDDLAPNQGGLVLVESEADFLTVTFLFVPEFMNPGGNSFSTTLFSNGDIAIEYGRVAAVDGLAGVTPGGGIPGGPGAVDLSTAGGLSAAGSTFERFLGGNPFDLMHAILDFLF